MGCEIQKVMSKPQFSPLFLNLQRVQIVEIDDKYQQIELITQHCEYLRQSVQESIDHIEYITKSHYLSQKDIKDDILIWLVYLSINQKGIQNVELDVQDQYPYIKLNRQGEIVETIYENLVCWFSGYLIGSKFINQYQYQISDILQQIEQEQVKVLCMQLKYDQTKTDSIIKTYKQNINKIQNNIERIKGLNKLINNPINHDYINEIINYIKEIDQGRVDRLADRFNKDRNSQISQIVYYLGEKNNIQDIKDKGNQKWINYKSRMEYKRVDLYFYNGLVQQDQVLKEQKQKQEQEPFKIEDIIQLQQRQEQIIEQQSEQIIKQEVEEKKYKLDEQQYEEQVNE